MDILILVLLIASLTLFYGNVHWKHPLISVLNRWLRCSLMALSISVIMIELEWANKPLWVLTLSFTLLWFFIESIYSWLGIRAMNFSPVSLFPKHTHDASRIWPKTSFYIKLKNWLKDSNFSSALYLKAELVKGLFIHSSLFFDKANTTRIHVIFIPHKARRITHYFILTSKTPEGEIIVTENAPIPFGGYYPDNWTVRRKPLIRSIGKLYKFPY